MAWMHFVYGLANSNTLRATRIYQERYPNRVLLNRRTSSNIHRRLSETGEFQKGTSVEGRPRTSRTPETEEAIQGIDEHPKTSNRKIQDHLI
nr:unnamed protein product [Callosobruchus chinensis]